MVAWMLSSITVPAGTWWTWLRLAPWRLDPSMLQHAHAEMQRLRSRLVELEVIYKDCTYERLL